MIKPFLMLMLSVATLHGQTPNVPLFELSGVVLGTPDLEASAKFYVDALSFDVERTKPDHIALRYGALQLVLMRREVPVRAKQGDTCLTINVQVADLPKAVENARHAGGIVNNPKPKPFVLGEMVVVLDPAGHKIHLLTLQHRPLPDDTKPRVFNIGCTVPDLEATVSWYESLGFEVFSRDYLPKTLPMNLLGAAALVFHSGANTNLPESWNAAGLLLATPDLDHAADELEELGMSIASRERRHDRSTLHLRDPAGLSVWVTTPIEDRIDDNRKPAK